jgi:hypothetical protein
MYELPLKYIRQTGRSFNARYEEHICDIRHNSSNSGYSNHILNTGHSYGSIRNTMKIIKAERKGKHLNTLEGYHIQRISKEGLHMNYIHIEARNPVFETLHEKTLDSSTNTLYKHGTA